MEKRKIQKNRKRKKSKKSKMKKKEKEFVFGSPGQNMHLLSLPYS